MLKDVMAERESKRFSRQEDQNMWVKMDLNDIHHKFDPHKGKYKLFHL